MTMGGIIAASMLSGRAMAPLGQVAGLMMQYQNARTSLASVGTHMNLPVERPEGASFVHRPELHRRHRVQGRQLLLPRPRAGGAQEGQLPPQGR